MHADVYVDCGPPKKSNWNTDILSSERRRHAIASLPYHGNGNSTFSNEEKLFNAIYCLVWSGLVWAGVDCVSVECILRMSMTFNTNNLLFSLFRQFHQLFSTSKRWSNGKRNVFFLLCFAWEHIHRFLVCLKSLVSTLNVKCQVSFASFIFDSLPQVSRLEYKQINCGKKMKFKCIIILQSTNARRFEIWYLSAERSEVYAYNRFHRSHWYRLCRAEPQMTWHLDFYHFLHLILFVLNAGECFQTCYCVPFSGLHVSHTHNFYRLIVLLGSEFLSLMSSSLAVLTCKKREKNI